MRNVALSCLLALAALFSLPAYAKVEFVFLQSYEVDHPAATGLKRGITFRGPVPEAQWPGDVAESVPTSMIAKTKLAMQYAVDHAYPAYANWVRVGNALAALIFGFFCFIGFMAWSARKHA